VNFGNQSNVVGSIKYPKLEWYNEITRSKSSSYIRCLCGENLLQVVNYIVARRDLNPEAQIKYYDNARIEMKIKEIAEMPLVFNLIFRHPTRFCGSP
jgi:hypothetical protein